LYFSTHDFLKLIVEQKLFGGNATTRMREASTSLRLSSHPRNVESVTLFIESLANKLRIAPDTYGNILISLTEAVNNAIIHGNKQDESKTVEVRTSTRNGCLAISVKDEGKGFDYNKVPDPTTAERICECGGRGVFLMRQLSDRCKFQDNGRRVEMEFKLGERL
jgi:serine/threonine-protein kinase RsbW